MVHHRRYGRSAELANVHISFLLLESSVYNCVGENSNIQKGRSAVSPDFIKIIEKRPFSHVTNVWLVFKYYLRILNHA